MTENLSPETLVDGAVNTPANGGGTVESPALTLAELNKHLGSDFKDPSTALKALKDTKDYVGKRREDIVAEVINQNTSANTNVASKSDVQELNNRLFLSENPQYKGMEDTLKVINPNLAEAVKTPGLQTLIEKANQADEIANNKSVVSSNSRLSQTKTVIDEAVNVANSRGTTGEDVATVLARAINAEAQG